MATCELLMKLLIDTKCQKVCFAEAGNDVVEFLSTLLCLPLSTIINLLTMERMVGSIGNVLDSVQELEAKYVISSKSKEPYLSPAIAPAVLSPLQKLLDAPLNTNGSFFRCEGMKNTYNSSLTACGYFSSIDGVICPGCSKPMCLTMDYVKGDSLVAGTATYIVKDDLSVTPASSVSSVALLAQCGVKDLSTLQERTVKIGKEEVACLFITFFLERKIVLTC